ncbi:MAG TPA: LLM class flavin-dependent oxidoreductase [Terriglobales bacterium]|nr:LLM class flavin-dependent oxidoreductase [Terriglobales bacterium]
MSEVGLGVRGDLQPGRYAELGELAERAGFDVLSVFGDLLFQPPLPALLLAARATRRLRLGPACLNPYTTHPVEIAGQTAVLDHVSGGRAYVGLARGAWLDVLGVPQAHPVDAVRDAALIVRALLAGGAEGHAGRVFRLAPGTRLEQPVLRRSVPLLVGAWGPRMCAMAGEIADELKVGGSASPAMVAVARSRLARDSVGVVLGAVTVVDRDGELARRLARTGVARYVDVVGRLDQAAAIDPELIGRLHDLVAAGDHEAAGRLLPDDLLDRFAFAGTPERVAAQAGAVLAAGARRVEFGPPLSPHGISAGIELLARRILPALRG